MKSRIIAVLNNKGGVGKTTTAANLSYSFSQKGSKVLAIDLDPQSHLSVSLGETDPENAGIDDVFLDHDDLVDSIITVRKNLDLVPAGYRLSEVEKLSSKGVSQAKLLHGALESISLNYDYILIDCPPTAGLLNFNALFAADELLIPVSSDYLALHGLSQLLKTVKSAESYMKKNLTTWIAVTRFITRRRLSNQVKDKLVSYFPGQVLQTVIRECAPIAESPSFGQSIFEYSARSNGAKDYASLADDLINQRIMVS